MSDQINVNALADTLNQKVDIPDGVNQSDVDYVVESKFPTDSDLTWYRIYKSGWVEQGGWLSNPYSGSNSGTQTITLPIEMADTNYYLNRTPKWSSSTSSENWWYIGYQTKTTEDFTVKLYGTNCLLGFDWEVKGMGA